MCSGLTAYAALKKVVAMPHPPPAHDVLVLGLGGLGFQALAFAQAMLGGAPLAADIDAIRLAEAKRRFGCATFDAAGADEPRAVRRASYDGSGIAAVIDFVNNEASHRFANRVLRKGGKLVIVGLFGGVARMPLVHFPFKGIAFEGCLTGSLADAKEMFALLERQRVEPPPHHFASIATASESLQELAAGKIVGRRVLRHDWAEARL